MPALLHHSMIYEVYDLANCIHYSYFVVNYALDGVYKDARAMNGAVQIMCLIRCAVFILRINTV